MRRYLGLFFLHYIRILAKIQLAKIRPKIVGITGSAGKSSVRNAAELILQTEYKCKVSGKANSESGIPLDILGLEMHDYSIQDWFRVAFLSIIKLITNWEKYDIYIVEMGVDSPDEPKNMGYLLKILRPNTGVFINAGAVHSEPFDHLISEINPAARQKKVAEIIANEKGRMIETLPSDGIAVLNMDDENAARFAKKTKAEVYGVCEQHREELPTRNVIFQNIQYNVNGFSCDFVLVENRKEISKQHLAVANQIFGPQYAITFALAIAVGLAHDIALDDCVDALRLYKLPPGRMSLIRGIKDSYIIDSSYNASAEPMIAALDVLNNAKGGAKKVAVLGDMRELGEEAKYEHERVAEKTIQIADEIVLVGPLMKEFFMPKAESLGFDNSKMQWFEDSAQAATFVYNLIQGSEVVLVKGSQNTIFLERVVEAIVNNPAMVEELLCRRGRYWDKIRQDFS